MKVILTFLILTIGFTASAQDFSGDYTSDYTTFKDEQNSDNNFQETTTFNIAIIFGDKTTAMWPFRTHAFQKKY